MVCVFVVELFHWSVAVHVTVMLYVAVAHMFNSEILKSYANSGSVSQLSEAVAEASQSKICAEGSTVSLMSPQSSTSGLAGTVIEGFCVSGTTVMICVFCVVLLQ